MAKLTEVDAAQYVANVMKPDSQDPTQCAVALREYNRQAFFANLFTALFFLLVAATVLVLLFGLGFLLWAILNWNSDGDITKGLKVIATLVSAAGTFVTGKAAGFVNDAAKYHDTLATAASNAATNACGTPTPKAARFSYL